MMRHDNVLTVCTIYYLFYEMLGNFSELINMDLSHNSLSGSLPPSIYLLTNLQQWKLGSNNIHSTISDAISQLSNLQNINLKNNCLYGTIPSSISSLSALIYLRLSNNDLEGTIPDTIQQLRNLNTLDLSENMINGTLSTSIRDLPSLTYLTLVSNRIEGTIPCSWVSLSSILDLFVDDNLLNGTIPSCIGSLTQLEALSVSGNLLSGTIPSTISELSSLQILNLSSNQLIGSIPPSFGSLTSLQQLSLDNNLLTGCIPDSMFSQHMYELSVIEVQNNLLSGTIPHFISTLRYLNRLFVQSNILIGNLDKVFNGSFQQNLTNVDLSDNQFTGELPEQLFLSTSLISVSAVSNCFHGSIPSNICLNRDLETLALDGLSCASSCRTKILRGLSSAYYTTRSFDGSLPYCLHLLPQLKVLHASGNSLKGTLPSSHHQLWSGALQDLALSYNFLTGSIPTEIQDRAWVNLDLSNNRLSGTLSSSYNSTSDNTSLTLKNNRLSGLIPHAFLNMIDINILEGGYYDCKYDRSDLPTHDSYKAIFECGSRTLDILFITWIGLFGVVIIIIAIIFLLWSDRNVMIEMKEVVMSIKNWMYVKTFLINYNNNHNDNNGNNDNSSSSAIDTTVALIKLESMLHYHRHLVIHEIMRDFSLRCTVFILCIMLPLFSALSIYYRTHTHEYAWIVAMMYLSGPAPFAMATTAVLLFIAAQIRIYLWTMKNYKSHDKLSQTSSSSGSGSSSDSCSGKGDEKRDNIQNNDHRSASYYSNCASVNGATAVWSSYIVYTSINLFTVTGVNILYVYVLSITNQSREVIIIAQVLISFFKITWNNVASPLMVRWMVSFLSIHTITEQSTLFFLHFVVSILNNIIIPCLMVAVFSPNCFYHVFYPQSDVHSKFPVKVCQDLNPYTNTCKEYITCQSTTSYSPPFIYSYECGAALVTTYAPVFAIVCILSTFIIPAVEILWIYWKIPNILLFSQLFYPDNYTSHVPVVIYMDEVFKLFVFELTLIGLILTFGVVYPPLVILFFLTIVRMTFYHQAKLGRYIMGVLKAGAFSHLDLLENNLQAQPWLSTIEQCSWVMLTVACGFYTIFLFDILGDVVGFYRAFWVLIVIPCIPLYVYTCKALHLWYFKAYHKDDDAAGRDSGDGDVSDDDVELSTTTSIYVTNPMSIGRITDLGNKSSIIDIRADDRDGESIDDTHQQE